LSGQGAQVGSKPRLLVVEDDNEVRGVIAIALRSEGYQVMELADGTELRRTIDEYSPDLAVLDVRLPAGPDGYTMARMLREAGNVPVLLLTAADSLGDRLEGFRAGADDYIGKPFSTAELLARVQALLRRAGRLSPAVLSCGDIVLDHGARTVTRAGMPVELTRTEYDILAVFLRHPGQVLSKHQLLVQLWGFDVFDPNVVQVHVSALRRKLEAHGSRMIQTVWGVGYVLRV
jgi:two-component system OmpR family response regulator